MTYLNLVNAVLRKLREDTVTTVDENDYSQLIGDFVNDAKRNVENAWDWSVLRDEVEIETLSGQAKYAITGYGTRGEIFGVFDTTNDRELRQRSKSFIRKQKHTGSSTLGNPVYYVLNGTDTSGDTYLELYPTPDATYDIVVDAVLRGGDLDQDADDTLLPSAPIIQFAFAYALRERGETGGQSAAEQIIYAQEDLRSAVALDASQNADELIWDTI